MIELYLSSDGKHTVHVKADTPSQIEELAPQAKALYEEVLAEYGTKAQMWGKTRNGQSNGPAQMGKRVDVAEQLSESVAPRCPKHDKPMAYRQGPYGAFWSCPVKDNGAWCRHTREISGSGDGQARASAAM